MGNEGFIKLHRKMLDWQWADDCTIFYFFVKLLFMVNYQEKQWHNVTVHRGQTVTSIAGLCEYMQMSRTAVQRCLRCLTETGEITDEVRPNKYRIITVKNYDIYQAAVDTSKANRSTNRSTNRNANRRTNSNTNSKANSKANSSATTKGIG